MSSHHPPLTCSEFKTILGKLGFKPRPRTSGTTHEHWVCTFEGDFYKVTVDCPKAPFSQDLISSMASQAGVTKKIIYDIHFGRRTGAKHGQELTTSNNNVEATGTIAAVARYEARRQDAEFWCVWDTRDDCQAFKGQYCYLTYEIALDHAVTLNQRADI
jgi:hypothetical protein